MKRAVLSTFLLGALALPALAQPTQSPDPPKSSADDLAKAADAAAEVAAVPATGAPAAGAGKASSDDIDLSALGLDPAASSFDDKLNVYGFIDFNWQNYHWTKSNPFVKDTTTFMLGNLNLYIAKNLTPRWRTLAEVRFMYAPNGTGNGDGTVQTTTGDDAANFGRTIQWGTISIERAYLEYDLTPHLTLRAGHFLTPYGIWNTDHGSPVIIGTSRPYLVGDGLFPEHQTGLELFGSTAVGSAKLGYHATISNGRSQTETTTDTDRKIAFGGRVELEVPLAGTLKVGASAYAGRYTSVTTSTTTAPEAFDERNFAGDVQWDHGGLHLQAEVITRHKSYVEGNRPLTASGPQSDGNDFGAYGLIGYRFTQLWNVMPFAYYEDYQPLVPTILGTQIKGYDVGLNFRPTPTVVLKIQGTYANFSADSLVQSNIYLVVTQAAWVF